MCASYNGSSDRRYLRGTDCRVSQAPRRAPEAMLISAVGATYGQLQFTMTLSQKAHDFEQSALSSPPPGNCLRPTHYRRFPASIVLRATAPGQEAEASPRSSILPVHWAHETAARWGMSL